MSREVLEAELRRLQRRVAEQTRLVTESQEALNVARTAGIASLVLETTNRVKRQAASLAATNAAIADLQTAIDKANAAQGDLLKPPSDQQKDKAQAGSRR